MNSQTGRVLSDVLRRRAIYSRHILRRALSDKTKEWIPPSRPLSGDKGGAHQYEGLNRNFQGIDPDQLNAKEIPDEIKDSIMNDKEANETVEYIDIDDIDLEEFQKLLDANQVPMNDGIVEDDSDLDDLIHDDDELEELMKDLNEMAIDDDDEDDGDIIDVIDTRDPENLIKEGGGDDGDYEVTEEKMDFILDKFQKHFEAKDFQFEKDFSTEEGQDPPAPADVPDWLSTRRAKLNTGQATGMLTPAEYRSKTKEDLSSDIPVIKHTLLSSKEIIQCLVNLGGQNVKLVTPEADLQPFLGWKGLIIATGTSYSHIRKLSDAIVYNLRARKLAERGVIGAKYGSEGGEDPSMSARARRKRNIGRGKKANDGWMLVDCRNYIVHVQDEATRNGIDLESLWSADSEEGKKIRRINMNDEDEIDDFVAENPVSDEYTESIISSDNYWGDGRYRGGFGNRSERESGRWAPSSNKQRKMKNRGRRR